MRFKVNVANSRHNFESHLATLKAEEYQNWIKHRQQEMVNREKSTGVAC